jgi:hypothetical protein
VWKRTAINGIQFTAEKIIQTILYADDQVMLQMAVNKLNIVIKNDIKASLSKTEQWNSVQVGGGEHKEAQTKR